MRALDEPERLVEREVSASPPSTVSFAPGGLHVTVMVPTCAIALAICSRTSLSSFPSGVILASSEASSASSAFIQCSSASSE